MSYFPLPAGELVRATRDVRRVDGSLAVPRGTSGIVRSRDDSDARTFWVLFKGASAPMAVGEGDVEPIPSEASAIVSEAIASIPGRQSCESCAGPLVGGESRLCRGCEDGPGLDRAVESDLGNGDPGQHGKPDYGARFDA